MSATATATRASTSSPPTAGSSARGASRVSARVSSAFRTASRWTARAPCTSPTARTAASNSSPPTATSWTNGRDVARPCQVFIDRAGDVYVAELGFRAGMWPGTIRAVARRDRRAGERLRPPRAAAGALGRRTESLRGRRLLRAARHLRRFARRRLRGRGGHVGGRQPRAGVAGLPLAAEVRSLTSVFVAASEVQIAAIEKGRHESLAFPRLRRHAARRRARAPVRAGSRPRRTALRAAERHRGAARLRHPDARLRPRQAAAGDRGAGPALRPRVLRPRPRNRARRDGFRPGDRVAARAKLPCGDCPLCRSERSDLCRDGPVIGFDLPGCFAERAACRRSPW